MSLMSDWSLRFKKAGAIVLVLFLGVWLIPLMHGIRHLCPVRPDGISEAGAVPAFARKYGTSCSQCHCAFPTLNAYGRAFKLNGYVRSKGSTEGVLETQDGGLWTEKIFPWGVVVRSRPYDKVTTDQEFKMQGVHNVDLFIAGGDAAKNVSWFGVMAADDDTGFTPEMEDIQLGYHPSPYLNLIAARRGFFVMDPYQTLTNFGSPTIGDRATGGGLTDQGSFSQDALDQAQQTMAAFGSVRKENLGSIYYAVGESAAKDDNEGKSRKNTGARLAFGSSKDNFMIGTFASFGHQAADVTAAPAIDKLKFTKTGVDAMFELGGLIGRGAFLYAYDNNLTTSLSETNRAAYGELMYMFMKGASDAPFLVPLIRQNWYQTADGTRQFSYFTAQLAHYFKSSVKAFIEYTRDTKQDFTDASPTVVAKKEGRLTVQAEVGF